MKKAVRSSDPQSDLARRIILRATSGLRLDLTQGPVDASHAYAEAASAAGVFRGIPPGRQDATMRNHLAKRFERRLDSMIEDMREVDESGGVRIHVHLSETPISPRMDSADLDAIDHGLRIVVTDDAMFEMLAVRDLAAPTGVQKNVIVDALRRDGAILVTVTAAANAVYGFACLRFDDNGRPVSIPEPTGSEPSPIDEIAAARIWDMLAAGARLAGREASARRRLDERAVQNRTSPAVSAKAVPDDPSEAEPVQTSMFEDPTAPKQSSGSPVSLLTSEEFVEWHNLLARHPATRTFASLIGSLIHETEASKGEDVFISGLRRLIGILRSRMDNLGDAVSDETQPGAHPIDILESDPSSPGYDPDFIERVDAITPMNDVVQRLLRVTSLAIGHARDEKSLLIVCDGMPDVETATIRSTANRWDIVVVKDRRFFEDAAEAAEIVEKTRREVPLIVLSHRHATGADGCVIQLSGMNMNLHARFHLNDDDAADDRFHSGIRTILSLVARSEPEAPSESVETVIPEPVARNTVQSIEVPAAARESAGNETTTPEPVDSEATGEAEQLVPASTRSEGSPNHHSMKRISQVAIGVADYAAAARAIDRWFDRTAARRRQSLYLDRRSHDDGWRLEHSDDHDEFMWGVAVRAGHGARPRIEIVAETSARRYVPSLPGVIREIASETTISDLDGPAPITVQTIASATDTRRLMRHLTDPDRRLPVLIMTAGDGRFMFDPQKVLDMALGALRVMVLTESMTRILREEWGQEYSVFNGAARIYQPGFDPETSNPLAHQRIMPRSNSEATLLNAVQREISATLSRYELADELAHELDVAAREAAASIPHSTTPEQRLVLPSYRGGSIRPEKRNLLTPLPGIRDAETDASSSDEHGQSESPEIPARPETPVEETAGTPQPSPILAFLAPPASDAGGGFGMDRPAREAPSSETAEPDGRPPEEDSGTSAPIIAPEAATDVREEAVGDRAGAGGSDGMPTVPIPAPEASAPAPTPPAETKPDPHVGTGGEPHALDPRALDPTYLETMVGRLVDQRLDSILARLGVVEEGMVAVAEERNVARAQLGAVQARALGNSAEQRSLLASERQEHAELIRIAEQETEDARTEAATMSEELSDSFAREAALRRQIAELRREMAEITGREQALPTPPVSMSEIGDWTTDRFGDRIIVHPRAYRALKSAIYDDVDRLAAIIETMATHLVDSRLGMPKAYEAYVEGLRLQKVEDVHQEDTGGPESARGSVVHQGRPIKLTRHIRANGTGSRERGALRIYYGWDEESRRIVIESMPDHLTNRFT